VFREFIIHTFFYKNRLNFYEPWLYGAPEKVDSEPEIINNKILIREYLSVINKRKVLPNYCKFYELILWGGLTRIGLKYRVVDNLLLMDRVYMKKNWPGSTWQGACWSALQASQPQSHTVCNQ